jgi:hypothetical protein
VLSSPARCFPSFPALRLQLSHSWRTIMVSVRSDVSLHPREMTRVRVPDKSVHSRTHSNWDRGNDRALFSFVHFFLLTIGQVCAGSARSPWTPFWSCSSRFLQRSRLGDQRYHAHGRNRGERSKFSNRSVSDFVRVIYA